MAYHQPNTSRSLMHLSSTHNSRRLLLQCPMFRRSIWGQQDAQKVCPARPQRVKTGGVPSGYVEDLSDARTTLADFFSILPENYLRVRTDWSAKLTRGPHFRYMFLILCTRMNASSNKNSQKCIELLYSKWLKNLWWWY